MKNSYIPSYTPAIDNPIASITFQFNKKSHINVNYSFHLYAKGKKEFREIKLHNATEKKIVTFANRLSIKCQTQQTRWILYCSLCIHAIIKSKIARPRKSHLYDAFDTRQGGIFKCQQHIYVVVNRTVSRRQLQVYLLWS